MENNKGTLTPAEWGVQGIQNAILKANPTLLPDAIAQLRSIVARYHPMKGDPAAAEILAIVAELGGKKPGNNDNVI